MKKFGKWFFVFGLALMAVLIVSLNTGNGVLAEKKNPTPTDACVGTTCTPGDDNGKAPNPPGSEHANCRAKGEVDPKPCEEDIPPAPTVTPPALPPSAQPSATPSGHQPTPTCTLQSDPMIPVTGGENCDLCLEARRAANALERIASAEETQAAKP